MTLIICSTPMREISRKFDGTRWCFHCRKRHDFYFVVSETIEPSYYDPSASIEGECGHVDADLFPGRVREWGDA